MASVRTNQRWDRIGTLQSKRAGRLRAPLMIAVDRQASVVSLIILLSVVGIASSNQFTRQGTGSSGESTAGSQTPNFSQTGIPESDRSQYQINLALDFNERTYTGSERVRWTNSGDHPASVLFFHLYSNVRSEPQPLVPPANDGGAGASDEPRIEVSEVRSGTTDMPLGFALDDQLTILRVYLREPVASGSSTTVAIKFKGSVPEIDVEETGLVTHVMKQVSAAIKGERENRRAREINFRARGVMLLGSAFPLLAVHDGDDWRRKVEPSIGDLIFTQASDYHVTVEVKGGVPVFASAPEIKSTADAHVFSATELRDFAIIAGPGLRAERRLIGDVTVSSVFLTEHERVGLRVLANAVDAVRIYQSRFGRLPFKQVTIAEAPLVAGLGSTEFAGLDVIASAFYVDFESAAMRNMPELIREQRASVEESLEWTVAHLVAQQWWGAAVGNDPAREPVLDEALAGWSALLYYKEMYGADRALAAQQDQLRGVYRLYRTFGSDDMAADRPARDYKNSFQYAAIVMTKGALLFAELEQLLGDQRFFAALQSYYKANLLEIADMDDLRGAFIAETVIEQRRTVARTFNRWLSSKRGDEDIGPPDRELAASLGLPARPDNQKNDRNAFTVFGRLGKFFWQQMTRIP